MTILFYEQGVRKRCSKVAPLQGTKAIREAQRRRKRRGMEEKRKKEEERKIRGGKEKKGKREGEQE